MQPIDEIRVRLDGDMQKLESLVAAPGAVAGAPANEGEGAKALSRQFEELKVRYLGKKGDISGLLRVMGTLAPEARPEYGKLVNELRDIAEARFAALQAKIQEAEIADSVSGSTLDATLPGYRVPLGSLHPMTQVREEIISFFQGLGFELALAPEVDNDWYNFEALNIPPDHPSRDMHDTFYVDDKVVLRTHTSNVQVHYMETHQDQPIRIIAPGFVYRVDNDATHSPMFQQVECLVVDKDISFANLKGTLFLWARHMFGTETTMRFRPSYFPFTEPSAEMDVSCYFCKGQGCRTCKQTGWIEIGGCGSVDPNVFGKVGWDPEKYTGFAFGFGIDRITMLKYGIPDISHLTRNDNRFLRQF
ncbi:MAG: phenylalanyl-tRNA synthetase, alpha subunit [Fibrobacteres bacterium]|nr:phenylalanyl-tRNA synthetase, alpha subunit [Fibrobacterota bacterium]